MKLDRKTREFLAIAKMQYPKADVERLYISLERMGTSTIRNHLNNNHNRHKHIPKQQR